MDYATIKYRQFEVTGAPELTGQPVHQPVVAGSQAVFAGTVVGASPLHFQWRFNTRDLAGATNHALVISNVTSVDVGEYSLLVSNHLGHTRSVEARLHLILPPVLQIKRSGTNALSITASASGLVQFESSADLARWEPAGGAFSNSLPVVPTIDRWRFFRARLK